METKEVDPSSFQIKVKAVWTPNIAPEFFTLPRLRVEVIYVDLLNKELRTVVWETRQRDTRSTVEEDKNLLAILLTEVWQFMLHPNMRSLIEKNITTEWWNLINSEVFKKALAEYKAYLKA